MLFFFKNSQSSKSNSSATLRQRGNNTNQSQNDADELRSRLGNPDLTESTYNVDNDELNTEPIDVNPDDYINELHDRLKTTDVERLYSRLPADIVQDEIDFEDPDDEEDDE